MCLYKAIQKASGILFSNRVKEKEKPDKSLCVCGVCVHVHVWVGVGGWEVEGL